MVKTQNTQTRTTAPVVKFICLYTHDLKRKHKRWQDGRLEFHTFNRRVMVYDDGGNFVGDSHRTKSHDVEDGDEFQLDRGNVIVQVAERVGLREQDITEIFARKPKPQENSSQTSAGILTPRAKLSTPHFQMRHLPLQSLLSTPGRQIGRAVIPSTSPFERRYQMPGEADHRPKRRKLETPQTNNQPATTVLLDVPPSPPRQPTTLATQDPPRRKRFSPPRVQDPGHAPITAHRNAALSDTPIRKSNAARSENIDVTPSTSRVEKSVPHKSNAPAAEGHQPPDSPARRPANTAKYKASATKRDLPPGKENRGTVVQGEKEGALSGRTLVVPGTLGRKAAPVRQLVEPEPPDEPTTALRLGSAQKRGLLVAKGPLVKEKRLDKTLAQHATRRAERAGGGQAVAVVNPGTETPVGSGPWSREAGDLLDYKRSAADEPAT